ncbi:MAG: hypothetical protein HZB99_02910 [Candidatus Harrisonbacteria bacterium]|nr:hypothetical protein [Candidatus Harrisonbacteria bacterium]
MNLRSKSVLEAAVKEYIRSGKPVSSRLLEKAYDFGAKEATIRNELNLLTQEGFLSQLHTSGGRVPTDKGYQMFVASTLENVVESKKILEGHYGMLAGDLRAGKLKEFVGAFSDEMKLLGVSKKEKEKEAHKSGLKELIEHLDVATKKEMSEVVSDFELLDRRIEEVREKIFNTLRLPQVFIGKSPITKSKNLSVVMDSFNIKDGKVLVAVIGPKRMDYDKTLKVFKNLKDELK